MDNLFSTWAPYAHSFVEGGFIVSIAWICLLQYFTQVFKLNQERREHAEAKQAICGLVHELNSARGVCSVALVESELLRQILSGGSPHRIVQTILQQFVPDPEKGWAAYVELNPEPHVALSRGFAEAPAQRIDLDDELVLPAWTGYPVTFHQPRIAKSRFLLNFSSNDRRRTKQLYVLGVQSGERAYGLLVTTHLFPEHAPIEQQMELARRLSAGLAQHIAASESQAIQERELRNSTDQLTIRALLDQVFDNPSKMTQQFLRTVQMLLVADRGVMFLSTSFAAEEMTSYVTSGTVLHPEIREPWQHCEEQLAKISNGWNDRILFDEYSLEQLNLHHAFKAAIVLPVVVQSKTIGTLCFTRGARQPFTEEQRQLVVWAVELLADKMSTAIRQAEIKRMAQLDAVTQIANRHTFDQELERELQIAYATNSELSLILFDYGHQAGDEVLRVMGRILRDSLLHLRAGDRAFCSRYGGEEFAVILPGVGPLGTARIAEIIRAQVEKVKVLWQHQLLAITVSGGIATFPENGESAESLIASADVSLYHAKKMGRNRIMYPDSSTGSRSQMNLEFTEPSENDTPSQVASESMEPQSDPEVQMIDVTCQCKTC
jgi:diguanylate cyclase (GGDEF)-like protein